MKLSLALLALFAVVSSAFELPTVMNRRAALARIAAAAPLAALAQQAQAARVSNAAISANWMESASSNTVLGVAKPGSVYGSAEPVLKCKLALARKPNLSLARALVLCPPLL